jgi:hypothetical protein
MTLLKTAIFGLAVISLASAGQIEVGQIVGGNNLGLTQAYVTGGCMGASCINTGTGAGGLNSGTGLNTTGFVQGDYDASLFQAAPATVKPFTGYSETAATPAGSTMNDTAGDSGAGVTFAMISDGTIAGNGFSVNEWTGVSVSSITIPVGVFGVADVWTMLNERWGTGQNTDITFNFSQSANGSTGIDNSVKLNLTNGQQIRGAVDCGTTPNTCSGYSQTLSSPTTLNGVTVTAENIYGSSYSYGTGHGKFSNSSGTLPSTGLFLDDQGFNFNGLYTGEYLVDIVVNEKNSVANTNQTVLSAITLDTASGITDTATPEPSTWLMFGTGLSALGFIRRRRKS